jgi:DNA-binding beta-propeller fold protein YncE
VTGELTYQGCFAETSAEGCSVTAQPAIADPVSVAVSPDGKSVYVTATDDDAISRFGRNRANGNLDYKDCLADANTEGCSAPGGAALIGANDVAVSSDNKSVYVTAGQDDSISHLTRNTSSGALSLQDCFADTNASGCTVPTNAALDTAVGVAVSPDRRSVYVTSRGDDSITHFTRNTSNGNLSYQGCFADTAAAGCTVPTNAALDGAHGVAVSPDNKSVYVASNIDDSISHFTRSTSNGNLTYQGCFADSAAAGCTVPGNAVLQEALQVAVSPDNRSVYLVSEADDSISHFTRSTSNGALSYQGCFAETNVDGCSVPGDVVLDDVVTVAVTLDGKSVYTGANTPSSISHFTRSTSNGVLSYQDCFADSSAGGCSVPADAALKGVVGVAVSSDNRSLYVVGESDAAISQFKRKLPPCGGQGATITGTGAGETIRGTDGPDVIAAGGGNDVVRGLAGNDVVCGGKGRDTEVGGKGNDRLLGQAGRDRLKGGPGRDRLKGGPGRDILRGGPGRDRQIQ